MRDEFIMAWLVVVTLVLFLVIGVTVYFVWRSGILSGDIPLFETTSETEVLFQEEDTIEARTARNIDSFPAQLYYLDPKKNLLASEEKQVKGGSNMLQRLMHVLEALREPPSTPGLIASIPPEIQFRTLFYDKDLKTVYVDLASLPESWNEADPGIVGACLYAITQTITTLTTDFEQVRFLVAGKDSETSPGGYNLGESFVASDDWLARQP